MKSQGVRQNTNILRFLAEIATINNLRSSGNELYQKLIVSGWRCLLKKKVMISLKKPLLDAH